MTEASIEGLPMMRDMVSSTYPQCLMTLGKEGNTFETSACLKIFAIALAICSPMGRDLSCFEVEQCGAIGAGNTNTKHSMVKYSADCKHEETRPFQTVLSTHEELYIF